MLKSIRKILAVLLSLAMIITLLPQHVKAETQPKAGQCTRIEWLSKLTKTFAMDVDDENYPDNYFADLDESSAYYYDALLAVQFGLIDVEAGENIYPEQPLTREFAAHTLNYCLGYQLEEQEYTYSDVNIVQYQEDAQVAINRKWFKLISGKFSPDTTVTSTEIEFMLNDAKTVWSSTEIDSSYENQYELSKDVLKIPKGTEVYMLDDGRIYISNCSKIINVGEKFAVYINDIPCVYTADKIEKDGNDLIITVSDVDTEDAFDTIDVQGTLDASAIQLGKTDDSLNVSYEEETEDNSPKLSTKASKKASTVNVNKKTTLSMDGSLNLGGQSFNVKAKIKNMKISYAVSLTGETFVKLVGDTDLTCSAKFDAAKAIGLHEVPIIPAQVPGIGGFDLIFECSAAGSFSTKTSGKLTTGVSYSKSNGFRIIKGFNASSFSFTAEATGSAGLKARLGITGDLSPIHGYVYAKAGGKVSLKSVTHDSGLPKRCDTFAGWVYASYGASANIKLGVLKGSIDLETAIYDENNSPIRVYHHYEDGKEVTKCARGINFKYYTGWNSAYWGSQWYYGMGAYGYDANGNLVPVYTYTLDEDNNATITGYKGMARVLEIPEEIDGYKVVCIGKSAFASNTSLTKVTLSDGVVKIENRAFKNCSNLKEVILPDNLETIEFSAFENCVSLTDLYIPKTITSVGYYDGYLSSTSYPFTGCDSLSNLSFAKGITEIPSRLFANTGLKKVRIPNTVTKIGEMSFASCIKLEEVVIPESVTSIETSAFSGCKMLNNATLPISLKSIGSYAFRNCISLRELFIPKTLSDVGNYDGYTSLTAYPFTGCSNLKVINFEKGITEIPSGILANTEIEEIVIPNTVTMIGDDAFKSCQKLKKVIMADDVISIGTRAFAYCENLEDINLSKKLRSLGAYAFRDCSSLKKINVPKTLSDIGYYDGYLSTTAYPLTGCDNLEEFICDEGTTNIPNNMFGNSGIKIAKIPNGILTVGSGAFKNCNKLERIEIGKDVTEIGNSCFENCSSLLKIEFPEKVEVISDHVLKNCSSLEEIKLNDNVKSIREYAFENTGILNIQLPSNISTMEEGTFYSCKKLQSIKIPDKVSRIEYQTFKDCISLENVDIPDSVNSIGGKAFQNCDKLNTIYLPNSVENIGTYIFQDCDALSNVVLGNGITKIPAYSFEHCDVLQKINLPYQTKSIGDYAFSNCVMLTDILIPRNTISISNNAFSYPSKMTVTGIKGTYAETYANENGMKFVNKEVNATEVTLSTNSIQLNKGDTKNIIISTTPQDFTDEVVWKSTDENIVSVTSDGIITAKNIGTATIKVTVGNVSASCVVTVVQPITSLSLNKSSLNMESGEEYQLTASIYPNTANNKELRWSSSEPSVATIDKNGKIKALRKGTTTITVETQDGSNISRTCNVTVVGTMYQVDKIDDLQSGHPYDSNCADTWEYSLQNAKAIRVTFNTLTNVEDGFDYIYLYDAKNKQIGKYTGTELAGKSIDITGNIIRIKLSSDNGGNEYGFKIDSIIAIPETEKPTKGNIDSNNSTTKNNNNQNTSHNNTNNSQKSNGADGSKEIKNPLATSVKSVKAKKKALTVTWKRAKGVTGYKIQYSLKKNFKKAKTKTVKRVSTISLTIKKLKSKKKYYIRIRTYKIVNGKIYQSNWSKPKSKKTK